VLLKNSSSLAVFEPANLGSIGKHDNYYTTEADKFHVNVCSEVPLLAESVCLDTVRATGSTIYRPLNMSVL
jgi:hypothetical protein